MQEREREGHAEAVEASTIPMPRRQEVKNLALGRVEAFVLSQIDGRSSVDELASMAGLPLADVCAAVSRLYELGAIGLPGQATRRRSQTPSARISRPPTGPKTVAAEPPATARPHGGGTGTRRPSSRGLAVPVTPGCIPRLRGKGGTALDIGVSDGFVLSQVDGHTSAGEIAEIAGIDFDMLGSVLKRLATAGAIDVVKASEPSRPAPRSAISVDVFSTPRSRQRTQPERPAPARRATPVPLRRATPPPTQRATPASRRPAPPSAPPRRASQSSSGPVRSSLSSPRPRTAAPPSNRDDGPCELDQAVQARIEALYARLATATHYDLLDLPRDADKKAIKKAYFSLVGWVHPDRHFGKTLGPVRRQLQELFVRITACHDTLVSAEKRSKYDRTLPRSFTSATSAARELAPPETTRGPARPSVPEPRLPLVEQSVAPVSRRPRIRIETGRIIAYSGPVRIAPEEERPPPTQTPAGPPPESLASGKTKGENRVHARVFVEAAEQELASGNVVAAAAQFRLALACSNSPEIRAAYAAVEEMAVGRRFEMQKDQAEAAEREGRWADAAAAYTRAHATRGDARIAERLANSIRLKAGDLRLAAKLAEEAVQQEPTAAGYRVTLAEVYAAAGLDVRAQGELRRALELAPGDTRAQALATKLGQKARER